MLSRAWYLIAGIAVAVALAGVGYYTGRARTLDRWALERAALSDSVDSARARSGRIGAELDRMTGQLDSALAQWVADSAAAQERIKQLAARIDDPASTMAVLPRPAVSLARSDTGAVSSGYAACAAVVGAVRAYRSACQATRDSLTAEIVALLARPTDTVRVASPLHRFALTVGPFAGVTHDGRATYGLGLSLGWRLW